MIRATIWMAAIALALSLGMGACKEESPAERIGESFEEAVDELRDAGDGTFERLGESVDEAIETTQEAIDDAVESTKKAVKGEG